MVLLSGTGDFNSGSSGVLFLPVIPRFLVVDTAGGTVYEEKGRRACEESTTRVESTV